MTLPRVVRRALTRWSHCLICGRPVPHRWWQRGLLAPIPLCRDNLRCHDEAVARGRV